MKYEASVDLIHGNVVGRAFGNDFEIIERDEDGLGKSAMSLA